MEPGLLTDQEPDRSDCLLYPPNQGDLMNGPREPEQPPAPSTAQPLSHCLPETRAARPHLKFTTSCIAPWCSNSRVSLKKERKPFHWVPKDPIRASEWYEALGLTSSQQKEIKQGIPIPLVCGDHFSACDYEGNSNSAPRPIESFTRKRQLKQDAVPSMPNAHPLPPKQPRLHKSCKSSCIVPSCTNTRYNIHKLSEMQKSEPDVTFHLVPEDPALAQKWMQSLKLPLLPRAEQSKKKEYRYVCSMHFHREDFVGSGSMPLAAELGLEPMKRQLRKGALPQVQWVSKDTVAPAPPSLVSLLSESVPSEPVLSRRCRKCQRYFKESFKLEIHEQLCTKGC